MNDEPAFSGVAGSNALFTEQEWTETLNALRLTPQQRRIVALVIEGRADPYIAWKLKVRHSTVRTHINRVFAQLGVHDRVSLVRQVFEVFRRGCGDCPRRPRKSEKQCCPQG